MAESEDGFVIAEVFQSRDLYSEGLAGVRSVRSVDGDTGKPIDEWIFQIRLGDQITQVRLGPEQMVDLHRQGMGGVASYDGRGDVR